MIRSRLLDDSVDVVLSAIDIGAPLLSIISEKELHDVLISLVSSKVCSLISTVVF